MSRQEPARDAGPTRTRGVGRLYGVLFYPGAVALALMMFTDAVAVVGRHIGVPVLGSIELVQASILVAASIAMVSATLAGSHAQVRLLLDRPGERVRHVLVRLGAGLSALFFVALVAGSVWIAADLWWAREESEVLHLPYRPLRLVVILTAGTVAALFLRQVVSGRETGTTERGPVRRAGTGIGW